MGRRCLRSLQGLVVSCASIWVPRNIGTPPNAVLPVFFLFFLDIPERVLSQHDTPKATDNIARVEVVGGPIPTGFE